MFSKFRKNQEPRPSGFPAYSEEDFETKFGVPAAAARQIAADYVELLKFDRDSGPFSWIAFTSGRNLQKLAEALEKRYQVDKSAAAAISRFVANIVSAHAEQARLRGLEIMQCTWVCTTCGSAPGDANGDHAALAGQKYDPAIGIETPNGFLLPGTAIACTCIGRAALPL